jgi:hypothetical protein
MLSSVAHRRINSSHFNSRNYLCCDIDSKNETHHGRRRAHRRGRRHGRRRGRSTILDSMTIYPYNVTINPTPAAAAGTVLFYFSIKIF